ncbi:MAG: hypothetical protein MUQ20_01445 [Deltaproteobacteria bacterium]|nr:hypothetical protein [Deltaproteobacteria bacterium]
MPLWVKLLIRAALSIGLAVLLSRWLSQHISYPGIISLAVFFLGMSYLSEYIRKRG